MDLYTKSCQRRHHVLSVVYPQVPEWQIDGGWYLTQFFVFTVTVLLFENIFTAMTIVVGLLLVTVLNAIWPVFIIDDGFAGQCLGILALMVVLELTIVASVGFKSVLFFLFALIPHIALVAFDIHINVKHYYMTLGNKNI